MATLISIPILDIGELLLFIENSPGYIDFVQNIFNNFLPADNAQFITQLLQSFAVYSPTSVVWQNFVANIISGGGGSGGGIDQIVTALSIYGMTQTNWMTFMIHIVNTPAFQTAINPEILAYLGTSSTYNATVGSDWYKFMGNITRSSILSPPLNPLPNPLNPAANSANPFITGLAANAEFQSWLQSMIAINDPPPLSFWQENGSSPGIFARNNSTTTEVTQETTPPSNHGSLTAVGPNWVSWRPKVTNQEVSIAIAPSLTGAFYLTDPSAVSPPNARGQNAVDLQMVRTVATQVASGDQSFAANASNTVSGIAAAAFGAFGVAEGNQSFLEGNSGITYGIASHGEGFQTVAGDSGNVNHATIGVGAHSEGYQSTASAQASHAQNLQCQATGQASHSGGFTTLVSGVRAFGHGDGSTISGNDDGSLGVGNLLPVTTSQSWQIGSNLNTTSGSLALLVGQNLTGAISSDGAGHTIAGNSIQLGGGAGGVGVPTTGTGLTWMAFANTSGAGATGGTWGSFNGTTGTPTFASYVEWDSKQQGRLREIQDSVTPTQHTPTSTSSHQQMKRVHDAIQSHALGRFVFWSSEPNEHHRIRLGDVASAPAPSSATGGLISGLLGGGGGGGRRLGRYDARLLAASRHLGVVCPFNVGGVIFNNSIAGWAHRTEKDVYEACVIDEDWLGALKSMIKGMQIPVDGELKKLMQGVQDEQGSVESIERLIAYLSQPFASGDSKIRGVTPIWSLPSNTATSGEFFNVLNGACLAPTYRPDLWFLRCRTREQVPLETRQENYLLRAIAKAKQKKNETTLTPTPKEEDGETPRQEAHLLFTPSVTTRTEVTIETESTAAAAAAEDEHKKDENESQQEVPEVTFETLTDATECKSDSDVTTKQDDTIECKSELDMMATKQDEDIECKSELDVATKLDESEDPLAIAMTKIAAIMNDALHPQETSDVVVEIDATELIESAVVDSDLYLQSPCPSGYELVDGACVPIEGDTPSFDEVEAEKTAIAVTEEKNNDDDMDEDTMMALVNGEGDAFYFFSHEQWAEFCDGIQPHHVTFNSQVDDVKFVEWKRQLKTRVVPGLPELRSIMDHQRAAEIERAYRKRWMVKKYETCRTYSKHEKRQFLASLREVKPLRVTRANPAFKPELAQSYKNRSARPHEWAMIQFGGVARVRHDGTAVAGREVVVLADGCVSLAEQYALSNTSAHKTYQCMRVIDDDICEIFLQ